MAGTDDTGSERDEEESVQEMLHRAMPNAREIERQRGGQDEAPDRAMTGEEMEETHLLIDGLIETLYDRGYTTNELAILFSTQQHFLNAARFDRHEYDRIALNLRLRQAQKEWEDEQDEDVSNHVLAETYEELGRFYRTEARIDVAKREVRREEAADE